MSTPDRTTLFERVVELRTATFELLDELSPAFQVRHVDSEVESAAVRLQGVANELGRIERSLRRAADRAA